MNKDMIEEEPKMLTDNPAATVHPIKSMYDEEVTEEVSVNTILDSVEQSILLYEEEIDKLREIKKILESNPDFARLIELVSNLEV